MVDYIPAQLHKCKSRWYIDYYAIHPADQKLHRKQVKMNRIKDKRERLRYAKRLVQKINLKLDEGWNPFIEQESPRALHRFSDVFKEFWIDKRDLRPDTLKDYKYAFKLFQEWIEDNFKEKDPMVLNFTQMHAIRYMEYTRRRDIGNTRYNNILGRQVLLWNWMKEHHYTKVNYFETIKKRKAEKKTRIMDIEPEMRSKIRKYLNSSNREYWLICMFAFHTLLRPKEIHMLRVKQIDVEKQLVFVPAAISKNKNDRWATIPDVMIQDVMDHLKGARRKNHYVFARHFRPGNDQWSIRRIGKYWEDLRDTLRLPKELQFYSLRDAGIIQKIRDGMDLLVVKELADHSSLEVTNKYAKIAWQKANEVAKTRSSAF